MKSIMQEKKQCYICSSTIGLEEHHCLFGNARKKSEQDGLKVWLCYEHHRGDYGVHGKFGSTVAEKLKIDAENRWLEYYNKDIEDFIKRYGKNYLS